MPNKQNRADKTRRSGSRHALMTVFVRDKDLKLTTTVHVLHDHTLEPACHVTARIARHVRRVPVFFQMPGFTANRAARKTTQHYGFRKPLNKRGELRKARRVGTYIWRYIVCRLKKISLADGLLITY